MDFQLTMPLFKINLMKLKLKPDGFTVEKPGIFEEWVTLELQDLEVS